MIAFSHFNPLRTPLISRLTWAAAVLVTAPAFAQTYTYDDGTTENVVALPPLAEAAMLQCFDAGPLADGIVQVDVAIGSALLQPGALDGRTLRIAVWEDPTDDRDPSDAIRVFESAPLAASLTHSDTKVAYPLGRIVPVQGLFWAGVIIEVQPGDEPFGEDWGCPVPGSSFIVGDTSVLDTNDLTANSLPPVSADGVFLIEAVGSIGDTQGQYYCATRINSTGGAAFVRASGSAVAVDNDLTLTVTELPPNQFGYFLVSATRLCLPGEGGSPGTLCVGLPIGRLNRSSMGEVLFSGPTGSAQLSPDLGVLPTGTGSGTQAVMSGDVRCFQLWYRDTFSSGFSTAVEIEFQ